MASAARAAVQYSEPYDHQCVQQKPEVMADGPRPLGLTARSLLWIPAVLVTLSGCLLLPGSGRLLSTGYVTGDNDRFTPPRRLRVKRESGTN